MDSSISSLSETVKPTPAHFRFFDLPTELRLKILGMVLLLDQTIDLEPLNYRRIAPRFEIFFTSRKMHEEAYPIFYGGHTFRIFPTHGRFFGNMVIPLVARLSPRYRAALLSLELHLGPGWSNPPKSWRVDDRLGLEEMTAVRSLKVFIQCDPSHDVFKGFRVDKDFFTDFSSDIFGDIIYRLPVLEEIRFDAWSSVSKDAPLMTRLLIEARSNSKRIAWGPERGWDNEFGRVIDEYENLYLSPQLSSA
ncbi:MAG: hypothetical protein FRX48_00538 [Lasallia pustulata]|uniref:F-box domain-containing protein n=1 Tax=Lasallia pustulata TaxID=136370 RepID=A0A5M8Q328_9LECA|nr:MAG: hypothetical protein FRX48_00538 [Lasallia pustulata]